MFKRVHKIKYTDRVEQKFQTVVDLIKDLDRREFNRLQEGISLAWEAYNKVRQAKTSTDKEVEEIENAEKILSE